MSACVVFEEENWQNSLGSGQVASKLSQIAIRVLEECIESDNMTTSNLPILSSLKSLEEIYQECSAPSWDGYNAVPLSKSAFDEAKSFLNLLSELGDQLPMPTITPEPDGGIEFEWYMPSGPEFSLSFNGTNVFTYSGIFDDNTETFGSESSTAHISPTIIANIQRINK